MMLNVMRSSTLTTFVAEMRGIAYRLGAALLVVGAMLLVSVSVAWAENYALPANPPNLSSLLKLLATTPEGGWVRVNTNLFQDVWTPPDLQPLAGLPGGPSSIIRAWSSFAWDPNRGDLIMFGGGHANYAGNDVYRWRGTTRQWERASLPSEVVALSSALYLTKDGPLHSPIAAHTYDNNIFLPKLDRFVTFGGAAWDTGAPFVAPNGDGTFRITGPYLWDPNRADGNKVGGLTGSHVQTSGPHPEIVGGQMWSNRDGYPTVQSWLKPGGFLQGMTAYAVENGQEVLYVMGQPGASTSSMDLYRYTIRDLNNPALDLWDVVGAFWDGSGWQGAGAYDPTRKLFVYTGSDVHPIVFWDLTTPGPNNLERWTVPQDATGTFAMDGNYGIDFDPGSGLFFLWKGGGSVWTLEPPTPLAPTGWRLQKLVAPSGPAPTFDGAALGRWKYIVNLDAFLTVQDPIRGDIWIYKPPGWQQPAGNRPPTVSLDSPVVGATLVAGTALPVDVTADDVDGIVTKVDFYVDNVPVASVAKAPFQRMLAGLAVGPHTLRAVATDNGGATTSSASITINVVADSGSRAATTTSVASTFNPVPAGTDLTFTAVVTGTLPTGAVQFKANGTPIADCFAVSLAGVGNARVATCTTNLALGSHNVVATYIGDVSNLASTSPTLVQTISPPLLANGGFESPALNGSFQYHPSGASWVFTGGAGISGNLTGFTGSNPDAPEGVQVALFQGIAQASQTISLAAGRYTLSFVAAQRANFQSGAQIIRVQVDGVTVGQYQPPGGSYTSFATPAFTVAASGTHTVTLVGVGTGTDYTAFVDTVAMTPVSLGTTTTVSSSANPVVSGAAVTFSAAVIGKAPTGSVTFTADGAPLPGCVVALSGTGNTRTAACSTASLSAGNHNIVASYGGDSANAASASSTLVQAITIAPVAASLALTSSVNPATAGQAITFSATVSGASGTPTGTVTFQDGATTIATLSLSGGAASFSTAALTAGTHSIGATYSGNSVYGSATATPVNQTVNKVKSAVTLATSANPSLRGVTFTAAVSGSGVTGSITFTAGGSAIAGCTAVPFTGGTSTRTAVCSTSSLTPGTHGIVAEYSGDANNLASSATLNQIVNATLLINGGFETPSVGGAYQYRVSGASWAFTGGGGIAANNSVFTAANPASPEGTQVAFLQNVAQATQSVTLPAGQYTLTFQAAQRANWQVGAQVVRVQVDGVTVGQYQPPTTSYTRYTTPVFTVATTGTHTIALVGAGTGSDYTAFVDAAQLTQTLAATTSTLASSANPSVTGSTVTFTATVTGNAPSGSVAFTAERTTISGCAAVALMGTGNIRTAACATSALSIATHSIVATYGGDANNSSASSGALNQTVIGPIANGGFEVPSVASSYQYGSSGATWVFTNGAGISANGTAFTLGNPIAPEGTQVAFLQAAGRMAQTLTMATGRYTLSLLAAQRGNWQVGTQVVQVQIDGAVVGRYTPPTTAYSSYTTPTFTINSTGPHTITLIGIGTGTDYTAFLDKVVLNFVGL